MSTVMESALPPFRKLEEDDGSSPSDAIAFVGLCLVLGIACRQVLRGTKVPYTVALLILGIAIGSIEFGTHIPLGKIGDAIRIWAGIDPDLLLAVFLPALLFESAFSMELHQIKRGIVHMIILAGPGVLISTFLLGSALKLFYQMVLGKSYDWAAIIKFLCQATFGAVGIGLAFGILSVVWIRFIFNDTVIEITLTIAVSYIAYFTAQEGAAVSGVLAVMTLGMFYSAVAKTAFKGESQQSLHHFWEMIAYIANTIIFILSGVIIAEGVVNGDDILGNGKSWVYLLLLYVYVHISRFIVVGVSFPLLQYFGYGLDWKEAIILIWSGLRGAVALSLSLSVKRTSDSVRSTILSSNTGVRFVFFTGGIVFLTLVVNGSTAQFILQFLAMDRLSAAKRRILHYTKYEMLKKALKAFGDLGDDEELGPADWPTVKKYITCLNEVEIESAHPHVAAESNDQDTTTNSNNVHERLLIENEDLDITNLTDIRERLLNGVQAAYWTMLDEGRITQYTANILMQSVDEAFDLVSNEPLCDWKGLKSHVHIPNYYKVLQSSVFPQNLVRYFTVERLESSCFICAAFLRAHRMARQQLHEFYSDIATIIINESLAEGEEANEFLEDVRVTFPQVLRVVKTRQVTYSVLNHLLDYVQNLEKVGLLGKKEMLHLHDAVQTDLKKLLRNPPLVKAPKITDLFSLNPLMGALPSSVRKPLEGSTKGTIKLHGVTLYNEGSKPNSVWLICTGVVKWTSESIKTRHSLHPTFTHGSTLGLYEVLTGKPYLCDIITDSVVLCFYIESHKILSMLKSDPSVEEFLWQESAIMLLKLLLPQKFENMAMQDLRILVAERSTMTNYLRGKVVEIPQRSIGILLEGFVKSQGSQEEIITSPAPLLSSRGYQSFQNLETIGTMESQTSFSRQGASVSNQGSSYFVETRSRVIIFDIAAFESDSAISREHTGLISWPEQHLHLKQLEQNPEGTNQQATSLSTRALQLSIYGNMVNIPPRTPSFPRSVPISFSDSRPLVSDKSEGASTVRKNLQVRAEKVTLPGQSSTDPKESHVIDVPTDNIEECKQYKDRDMTRVIVGRFLP